MSQLVADPYDVWVERNPLRVWRKAKKWSIMRVASRLGVSMTIVQLWEKGVHVPSDENMSAIAELCGSGTVGAWARWFNDKPKDG